MREVDRHHRGYYARNQRGKRIFCRNLCFIKQGEMIPGHPCVGDNRISPLDGFIHTKELIAHISSREDPPEEIRFSEIWHQVHLPNEREIERLTERFQKADASIPGIVSPVQNPGGKPYRMIDGRRRMWKLMDQGHSSGNFFVISPEQLMEFFWMVLPMESIIQMVENR